MSISWNEIGAKINSAAKKVGNKTTEAVEVQKLKNKINACEKEINAQYALMGKLIYEKYQSGEVAEEFLVSCDNIKAKEREIAEIKGKINNVKGFAACKQCGCAVDANAAFCKKCGAAIED